MGDNVYIKHIEYLHTGLYQIDVCDETTNKEYRLFVKADELQTMLTEAKRKVECYDNCIHKDVCSLVNEDCHGFCHTCRHFSHVNNVLYASSEGQCSDSFIEAYKRAIDAEAAVLANGVKPQIVQSNDDGTFSFLSNEAADKVLKNYEQNIINACGCNELTDKPIKDVK